MATNTFSAPPPNTTVPQLIEAIWRHVHYRINSGDVNNIVLPLNFKAVIGQQGMEVIVNRFKWVNYNQLQVAPNIPRRSIQAPVTMYENGNAIFLKPTASPDGKITIFDDVSVQSQPKRLDKSKVPRPPNAFILYRQHHHPIIKSENPDMHNNQICKLERSIIDLQLTFGSYHPWSTVEERRRAYNSLLQEKSRGTQAKTFEGPPGVFIPASQAYREEASHDQQKSCCTGQDIWCFDVAEHNGVRHF